MQKSIRPVSAFCLLTPSYLSSPLNDRTGKAGWQLINRKQKGMTKNQTHMKPQTQQCEATFILRQTHSEPVAGKNGSRLGLPPDSRP